ncbi:hypothetical protein BGZ73_005183 [Actinomortierella ambigua]|nr:hypothetical protein BGZ73_005183 [Actinomortierella ambigua]
MEDVTRWKKRQRRPKKPASHQDDPKSNDDDDGGEGVNGDAGDVSDMHSAPLSGNSVKQRQGSEKAQVGGEEALISTSASASAPAPAPAPASAAEGGAVSSLSSKAKKMVSKDDALATTASPSSSSSPSSISSPTSSTAIETATSPSGSRSTETPPDEPSYEKNADGNWPRCGKEFTVASRLTTHYRIHSGKPPYLCGYKDCQKAFHTSSSLSHHRVVHTDQGLRPYVCRHNRCGATYTQLARLITHQRTTHSGMILFIPQENGANSSGNNNIISPPVVGQTAPVSSSTTSPAASAMNGPSSSAHAVTLADSNSYSAPGPLETLADVPMSSFPHSSTDLRVTACPPRVGTTPVQQSSLTDSSHSPSLEGQQPMYNEKQAGKAGSSSQPMDPNGLRASRPHPNLTTKPWEQHESVQSYSPQPTQQQQHHQQKQPFEPSQSQYHFHDQQQQQQAQSQQAQGLKRARQDSVTDGRSELSRRPDPSMQEYQRREGAAETPPISRGGSNGRHSRQHSGTEGNAPPINDTSIDSGRQTASSTKMEVEDDEEARLTNEIALAMTAFSERAMVQQQQQQQQQPYAQGTALPSPAYEYPPRLDTNGGSNSAPRQQAFQPPPARYPPTPSPHHYSSYPFHTGHTTHSSSGLQQQQQRVPYYQQDSVRNSGPYREDHRQYGASHHHQPHSPSSQQQQQQQTVQGGLHLPHQRPVSPISTSRPPSRGAGSMPPPPHHHPYKSEGHTRSPSLPGPVGSNYGYRPLPTAPEPCPSPGQHKDDHRAFGMMSPSSEREYGHERKASGNASQYGPGSGVGIVGGAAPPPTPPLQHQHAHAMADRQYPNAPPSHTQHQRHRSYDMRPEPQQQLQQPHSPYPPLHSYGPPPPLPPPLSAPPSVSSPSPSPVSPQGYRVHPPLPPSQPRTPAGYGA